VRRRRRRAVPPDLVDQTLDGNGLLGTDEQSCEHGTLLATAELERAIVGLGLERTEDAEAGWLGLVRRVSS
jgi:hypothetical protein